MRKTLLGVALASCAALIWGGEATVGAQAQQQVLVIQGGTLIDGNGGAPVPNSVVVVTGNRITAVGRQGQVQVPAGAQVINAAGKWVLPGFVDAKANWYWQYGEAFLHYGVTTAFVSGGRNNLGLATRDAINHGIFEGPRLFQSVINIGGPGPMVNRPDNYEPGNGDRIPRTSAEAVDIVRAVHEAGGDIITFANGDGPPEIFDAAVKEALRLGMGIDFRAMGPQTRVAQACEMGGPIVYVHTGNPGPLLAKNEAMAKWANYTGLPPDPFADMDEAKVQPMIQKLIGCQAYLEPDLMATGRGFSKNWKRVQEETYEVFKDPALLAYYPQHSILDLHEHLLGPETYLRPEQIQLRAAGFANHARFLKRYVDAGGKIVAASDITQTPPGLGLHQEMAVFVEDVGLTPMQAIQSATKWVSEGFRKPDIGSIAQGKLADIVILTRDPLQNILNTRSVETVIKDGRIVDRGYDPAWRGGMFSFSADEDTYDMIPGAAWAASLKQATAGGGRGGGGGNQPAAPPPALNPAASPTPGIEGTAPHTILRGSPDTDITVTGFNFVQRSQAYYDGVAVPTRVVNRNQLVATIPNNLLGRAGAFKLLVKNPEPLAAPAWGSESNYANILVPFEFTKILPQPRW
jgi:imidazolonepropionase-like amidohydrolase